MIKYLSLIFLFLFLNVDLVFCGDHDGYEDESSMVVLDENNDRYDPKNTDKWIAVDKLQHFSYSCLISLGCQYVLVNKINKSETSSLPLSSGLSFGAGLLKELNDNKGAKGYFSIKDMVANAAGIIVAAIIILHGE